MERRSFGGPGLTGDARPALDRLLTELGVAVPIRHAVSGIVSGPASAIQAAALSDAVNGENLLAVAPTGSGKTLVFAIGVVHRISGAPSVPGRPRAIVVAPTRELALQNDEVLAEVGAGAGLRSASFVGGLPLAKDKRALIAPVDIAVGTPGRLVDLIRSGALDPADIRIVVLDEVDQLLDASFGEQTAALLARCAGATLMATTATADADVEAAARRRRPDLRIHRIEGGGDQASGADDPGAPESTTVVAVPRHRGDGPTTSPAAAVPADSSQPRHLIILTADDPGRCATSLSARCRRALFFVARRDAVEPLRASIADVGVPAAGVSGSASPNRRATAFGELASGAVRVLVTTDLAGRGLDLEDIGQIVHVGPPHSIQDLVHRSGRTGRGGNTAGTVAAVVRPGEATRVIEQARKAGMSIDRVDADATGAQARLDAVFGPEIEVPRRRREPAPKPATRRPARSRVHRPKRKKRL